MAFASIKQGQLCVSWLSSKRLSDGIRTHHDLMDFGLASTQEIRMHLLSALSSV